ncbi:uncharacterized protein LOC127720795 [Mytilus californianus]|uniref:uncharacterized protein LOC127720795 n=1 Tax=Mytilus californianus TaxID=6549 RepID=UPI00224668DB|nr:uncharacterized protein LOC127720795 [Mytilus californianus]
MASRPLKTSEYHFEAGHGQNNAGSRRQASQTPQQRPKSVSIKESDFPVKKVFTRHPKEVECFRKSKYFTDLKLKHVKLFMDGGQVVIAGPDEKSIKPIKQKVEEQFGKIKSATSRVTKSMASLLTMEDVMSFIDLKLDIPKISVAWGIDVVLTEDNLIVYALSEKDASEKLKQIKGCIKEIRFSMEESQSEKNQNLIKSNSSRLITSSTTDRKELVVYTTQDIHDQYFQKANAGNKSAKERKSQAPNPNQQGSTNSAKSIAAGSGGTGNTRNTSASQPDTREKNKKSAGSSKDNYDENGDPIPDYDPVNKASDKKFIKVPLKIESAKIKYLEKYECKKLDGICGKYDVSCEGTTKMDLSRKQANIASAEQELYSLAEKFTVMDGFSSAGKPVIGECILQEWEGLKKDKKCMIVVEPCHKPVLKSGWIAKTDNQLNILFMSGTLNTIEADIILCPVNKELVPIGFDSEALMGEEKQSIKVLVEQGSILDYDTKVDVLVNSVGALLDLSNGIVSKKLLKIAGNVVQDECNKTYKKGINIGEIAITSPGNMKCKKIFHVALYVYWVSDGNISVEILKNIMIRCMNEAEERKMTSIAFPALGTGKLGYPPCFVAKTMFAAVDDYERTNPTYLKQVYIVLFGDTDVLQHFKNIDKWRKDNGKERMEYDIPPKHLVYIPRDFETRVTVADMEYYSSLKYKDLKVVVAETGNQAYLKDTLFLKRF